MHVQAVRDEPDRHPVVGQRRAGEPRLAVVERRHRVEQVGDEPDPGVEAGRGLLERRVAVAGRDDDAARDQRRDDVERARAAPARA